MTDENSDTARDAGWLAPMAFSLSELKTPKAKQERVARLRIGKVSSVLVLVVAVGMTTSCATPSTTASGPAYLATLENSHRVDPRAKKVCVRDQVSPFSSSTPIDYPIVAVDSTLAFVRKLEKPGYAKRTGDAELTGSSQGYAAICLFKTTANGSPADVWSYSLPNGDQGSIVAR